VQGFITVGSNNSGPDSLVVARSSNYGQRVDLFAPGVMIYSTVPGNRYETYSGSSMASPMVSGVAALLLEYYPQLSATQLREIIRSSVLPMANRKVRLASINKLVNFSTLCSSAGILNAAAAMKIAAARSRYTTSQKIDKKGRR
jgi:subtilisin family serine protease